MWDKKVKPKTRGTCFLCPLATSTRVRSVFRDGVTPQPRAGSCTGAASVSGRGEAPPPPGWTTPPPYPLVNPPSTRACRLCRGRPNACHLRAQTPPRLSPGLPLAPGSCEMHGRAAEPLWLGPSALLHQGHLRAKKGMHRLQGSSPGTRGLENSPSSE